MLKLMYLGGLLSSGLLFVSGCTTEATCFQDCTDRQPIAEGGDGGTSSGGKGGSINIGFGGDDGPGPSGGKAGMGQLEDAGNACDNVDLTSDPNNCGECGRHCVLTGAAESACVDSECVITSCFEGRYDVNMQPEDGCELVCDGDPDAEEVCNDKDDDCDGMKDEGFDRMTDVDNCGACGRACDLFRAGETCEAGDCAITECEVGYHDVDNLDSTGCEYPCEIRDKNGDVCDPATADAALGCGIEVCDTWDQDCDGSINDDTVESGQACSDYCPTPDCFAPCTAGQYTCVGTDLVCVPGNGPSLDICDEIDNDCDGTPDEDFDLDTDTENCGSCGTSCVGALPHAIAKCENQQCVIDVCETDYGNLDTNAPGCEACPVTPVRSESCNGKDDDCDGQVDEAAEVNLTKPAVGTFCKQRNGTLCNNVPVVCDSVNTKGWLCQYPAGVETVGGKVVITESLCNGIDGNCDTQVDEAFLALGDDCDDGALGVCLDEGVIACDPMDATKTYCDTTPAPNPPNGAPFANESCNGLDDNCDGQIDETTDDMVRITRASLDFWIDKYEASRPDASSNDVGSDETHLCGNPNRLPWTNVTFDEAETACLASDKRLCTIAELQEACEGASARTYPYAGGYSGTTCNGIDAAGSAAAPTGSFGNCVSEDGVYDLSGNVAEWSSTVQGMTTGNPSYDIIALHGGSYLTPQNGLTCRFDLDVMTTNAVLGSIGFRCCKDP
jgi:hypothetical protein